MKTNTYSVGDWVYYFNPRKFRGRQDKWERKYTGPFLVIRVPSSVTVRLQKNPKSRPFKVHIDKVKPYLRTTPKSCIEETNMAENEQQYANETEDAVNEASAEQQQ